VWEMMAELRKFDVIGRHTQFDLDVKSIDPELFEKVDSLVESTIKAIGDVIFQHAFKMSTMR